MKKIIKKTVAFIAVYFITISVSLFIYTQEKSQSTPNPPPAEKISAPGRYQGYSQPAYAEWVRSSQYVPVRDGTRLAVDIFRPSRDGKATDEPLPVILTLTPYRRAAALPGGKLLTVLNQNPWLETLLKHGYIVGAVDIRGSGASFGVSKGAFTPDEAEDAHDIIEWFAGQPWSSGKVGMQGISYLGMIQYLAASAAPPHLAAIMPDMGMFDAYSFTYPGGVFQDDFISEWSNLVKVFDTIAPATPVDDDPSGKVLGEALKEHQKNAYPVEQTQRSPYRDSFPAEAASNINSESSPHAYLKGIQERGSHIGVYHVSGWFDMWPRDAVTWFNNLRNPQKIIITPWSHGHDLAGGWNGTIEPLAGFVPRFDYAAEMLRWFDYWLKGIDNGIMNEPPVYFFTMGAPESVAWKFASQWPLPEEVSTRLYFLPGRSETVASPNDGMLGREAPSADSGQDDYVVDYTTTSGPSTRWHNGRGGNFAYPDMAANDAKGLTYTTEPLKENIQVTGHPVIHLCVAATADDADFFVYLEEVDQTGFSHYISEGVLRASHRKLSPAPYKYMNLPYHRSFREDIEPLPVGQPAELVFDLHPTSNIFDTGHRIRVTVTCADQTSFRTPELAPPPRISVYRNSRNASFIQLPVIPSGNREEAAKGIILTTTLIVVALIFIIIALFVFMRARLKK